MSLQSTLIQSRQLWRSATVNSLPVDTVLLTSALALLGIGLVMIGSASVGIAERLVGDSSYFLLRQMLYAALGLIMAAMVWRAPLALWQESSLVWLIASLGLLLLLFVPALGKTVNSSTRWLGLGPFNLQVSEVVKLAVIIYLAGYLERRGA